MARKRKSRVELVAEKPAPSPKVADAIAKAEASQGSRPVRPSMECDYENGAFYMGPMHNDANGAYLFVKDTLGTSSGAYTEALLLQIVQALGSNDAARDQAMLNAGLSFIGALAPANEVESALAVQMWTTHSLAMRMAAKFGTAEYVPQLQTYGNLATKLQRTFTAQLEALSKLRRGGEQVVRHIHVDNRGGQAVIAETINTGGAGNGNIVEQSHATGTAGVGPALLGPDPFGNGVPISCGEGEEAMPDAWRDQSRRTKGQ